MGLASPLGFQANLPLGFQIVTGEKNPILIVIDANIANTLPLLRKFKFKLERERERERETKSHLIHCTYG